LFDRSYFRYVHLSGKTDGRSPGHRLTRIYSFKGSNAQYIVEVEEFEFDVFILKFYQKSHRLSSEKFNLLTMNHDVQGVIRTVLDIALDILKNENPHASFGFVGTNKPNEEKHCTQRFRIYRQLMKNFFGSTSWVHYEMEDSSAYLMLNRCHAEQKREVIPRIVDMFRLVYDDFGDAEFVEII
jgi:hypothetical protein